MNNHSESKPKGSGQTTQSDQQSAGISQKAKQATKQAIISLLSRAQVATIIGTCPHTVQRLTRRGVLPAIVFNSRLIRYHPDDVQAYIRSAMTSPPQEVSK